MPTNKNQSGVKPERRNVRYHGWVIARSALLIQVVHSGLVFNSFSLFTSQLQRDFGWSNSVFGTAFAANRAESGILGPLQGWMTDRFGPKWVMRIGAVIMSAGFLLFSTIDTVYGFYASYLMVALGSSLSGFLTVTVAIVSWFERKRSRALATGQMGFAIGGAAVFGVGMALDEWGWRVTARIAAVIVVAVILPLSRHFHHRPADLGLHVDGLDPNDAQAMADADQTESLNPEPSRSTVHFTAAEAMRTKAFWFISFGHASALLVVGASMAHLALFLEGETELGSIHVSIVVGVLPAVMGMGQLVGGLAGDRYNKRYLTSVAMLGHGLGLLALSQAHGPILVWVFVVLHGLAWGVRAPLQQALRADYFGSTDFGKIMGFSSLIVMMGMMTGPIVAGLVADATGSFRSAFIILAVGAASGAGWFFNARPPAPPRRASTAAQA